MTKATKPKITIVDQNDRVIGAATQQEAQEKGFTYRLVAVLLFNSKNKLYLQLRPPTKKISPNKWDNSAGGHVDEGESYLAAAKRELKEELGISGVKLTPVGKFYYEKADPLVKRTLKRFAKVFKTVHDGQPKPDSHEVAAGKWVTLEDVLHQVKTSPDKFTTGFKLTLQRFQKTSKHD